MEPSKLPPTIALTLTFEQLGIVHAALGELPFKAVAPLMNAIGAQVDSQLAGTGSEPQ